MDSHCVTRVDIALGTAGCQESMLLNLQFAQTVEVTSIPGQMGVCIS